MTVQFYSYLAAVEVQPQSVATPTHKFTRARYTLIGAAPLPGQAIDCPGQILQIRDCPGDSGTVGAYEQEVGDEAEKEEELEDTFQTLETKHESNFSSPQLRLWA